MGNAIPAGISREDQVCAIRGFDAGASYATAYDRLFEGCRYPPQAIVGLAAPRSTTLSVVVEVGLLAAPQEIERADLRRIQVYGHRPRCCSRPSPLCRSGARGHNVGIQARNLRVVPEPLLNLCSAPPVCPESDPTGNGGEEIHHIACYALVRYQ